MIVGDKKVASPPRSARPSIDPVWLMERMITIFVLAVFTGVGLHHALPWLPLLPINILVAIGIMELVLLLTTWNWRKQGTAKQLTAQVIFFLCRLTRRGTVVCAQDAMATQTAGSPTSGRVSPILFTARDPHPHIHRAMTCRSAARTDGAGHVAAPFTSWHPTSSNI